MKMSNSEVGRVVMAWGVSELHKQVVHNVWSVRNVDYPVTLRQLVAEIRDGAIYRVWDKRGWGTKR
jgi:hypothetical protein